ncbi:MAG: cytochrome b5 domain-containing protein [Pontimonas sp.]
MARSQDKNYACCIPEESTGLFDLVTGLPLHPLINHVVVVMVPLAVVTMVLVIIVPRLRRTFVPVGLVFSFLSAVSAFIAEKSGEALQSRVGSPGEHAELGEFTTWIDSHPGGARDILNVCGVDGTDAFNSEHARDRKALVTAEEYVLGALGDPLN